MSAHMAYDYQEQGEVESLKAFWRQYGSLLMSLVTIALLVLAAYLGWNRYQASRALDAAAQFDQLKAAVATRDLAKVGEAAGPLFDKYSSTPYGQMAALMAAKAYVDGNDSKAAQTPLNWAIANARDPEFREIARVRLAGVLLDEKQYDEALKILAAGAPGRFAGQVADRRGDVLAAQGKREEARTAYREALDKLEAGSPLRRLIDAKLDGLGGVGS